MKIVQKVIVYNDYVGEETVGIGVIDSSRIQRLIDCYEAVKVCAKVIPAPNIIEFHDPSVEFYKAPDLWEMEESEDENVVALSRDLEDGKFVLMDDLSPLNINQDDSEQEARVESVYLRFYPSRPNELSWTGYVRGTTIEIELPGFYLDDLIREGAKYEAEHSNQDGELAI